MLYTLSRFLLILLCKLVWNVFLMWINMQHQSICFSYRCKQSLVHNLYYILFSFLIYCKWHTAWKVFKITVPSCEVVTGNFPGFQVRTAEGTLWYNHSLVTHWGSMTWAALSYSCLSKLQEPFPTCSHPRQWCWAVTRSAPSTCESTGEFTYHQSHTHMKFVHLLWQKLTFSVWMGGPDNPLSHMSFRCCSGLRQLHALWALIQCLM